MQPDVILDTGSMADRQITIVGYVDSTRARTCHHKGLPCNGERCITKVMTQTLFRAIDGEYTYTHRDAELTDKANGVLIGWVLKDIKERMETALNEIKKVSKHGDSGKLTVKPFEIFSGHDDWCLGVASCRGYEMRWLHFELWQRQDNFHHVRIIFNGKVLELK